MFKTSRRYTVDGRQSGPTWHRLFRLLLFLSLLPTAYCLPSTDVAHAAQDTKSTGSLTAANQAVTVNMPAVGSVAFQVTGTFSATLTFEASVNAADFVAIVAANLATGAKATTTTATGIYVVHAPGARYIRARVSAFTSGTVVVFANATLAALNTASISSSAGGTVDTELPAATLLGDAVADTVTTPQIGSIHYVYDASIPAYARVRSANNLTDGAPGGTLQPAALVAYNGTAFDRIRIDANKSMQVVAGGYTATVNTTLTRPANQTAYAANDEVTDTGGAVLTFTSAARVSGGTGVITGVTCSVSSNAATKPSLELWLFDTTTTPGTDNTAFSVTDGVNDTLVAIIPMPLSYVGDPTSTTGNFVLDSGIISIPYTCVGSANLFGRVVVRNAYTAGASSDTYKWRLRCLQD